MKLQYLAVIFIIIILPITIVFSEYIGNQISTLKIQNEYDAKLFNSTYDAIKAYQLNTINNAMSDKPVSKITDLEAGVNTFFESLNTKFGYSGYRSEVMKAYVPAVVFTMYDGYYIYSPFMNTLTGVSEETVDSNYKNGKTLQGLKPYVYYSCEYVKDDGSDFVITYSLDNYISIEGMIYDNTSTPPRLRYVFDYGYLIDLTKSGVTRNLLNNEINGVIYDGIYFRENDTEALKEFIGEEEYYYVKIDGTKFYYHGNNIAYTGTFDDDDYIFYIDERGAEHKQISRYKGNEKVFELYYKAIFKNKSAFIYYRDAYEFTNRVLNKYKLNDLTKENIKDENIKNKIYIDGTKKIFDGEIEKYSSNFNEHRMAIIKEVVETNLSAAISGFKNYANGSDDIDFIMPKISDTDWNLISNNICIATFMQGMSIGGKIYNGYSVIPNNLNKEYIDENDIYILKNYNTYTRANDKELLVAGSIPDKVEFYPGFSKINFERKVDYRSENKINYYPIKDYYASYTGVIGSTSLNDITYSDMYTYMHSLNNSNANEAKLKRTYYSALGRERVGMYNVNNGLKSVDKEQYIDIGYGIKINLDVEGFYLKNYMD